jgi:hypothetical protein
MMKDCFHNEGMKNYMDDTNLGVSPIQTLVPFGESLPNKNEIYIIELFNQKFEFLVVDISRLTWLYEEGQPHGVMVDMSGVLGKKL